MSLDLQGFLEPIDLTQNVLRAFQQALPAAVNRTPRLTRSNSRNPSSRSRIWICRVSADCATRKSSLALRKFSRRATWLK
jgi:hypothetical protein